MHSAAARVVDQRLIRRSGGARAAFVRLRHASAPLLRQRSCGRNSGMMDQLEIRVQSRSAWMVEKVRGVAARGCRPERDHGVRVNIEPLKQAGILPQAAERVRG